MAMLDHIDSREGQRRFFEYARKRYQLMLDKEADFERPWTDDPILQEFRFCNVFRGDDRVTKWVRKHITVPSYGEHTLGALVIARWFNRIETLERLLVPADAEPPYFRSNLFYNWDCIDSWKIAMRERLEGISPLVTAAYMIKTPAKMSKLEGLLWCFEKILPDCRHLQARIENGETTLEGVTEVLAEYPYLGPFMAYEIVCDLYHTPLLDKAPDIMTWANPGPGAARGLGRVQAGDPKIWNRHSKHDVDQMMLGMRTLLKLSQSEDYWPKRWPSWDMRTVEHTLCEFDKYERARLGEGRPKQRYRPFKEM